MKSRIISVLLTILIFTSCTKEGLKDVDYFSFGKAYGFCLDNCATFFNISGGQIYPDDMNYYYGTSLKFKSEALSAEKYNLAKKLIEDFPKYLKDNPDKTFGCPDCADQGGIHIEVSENGQVTIWHLDTNISSLPSEIQGYVKEVSSVIDQLK